MKKILLFFSLAVFIFILAGSVQAAVNNVEISIISGRLNYGTIRPITWTAPGLGTSPAPRFDISIVAGAETRPVATRILCNAPADSAACAFSWRVGNLKSGRFSMGVDYRIRVCVAGTTPPESDCDQSADAFKILPPELRNQQQVFDLFRTAMGGRFNDLNAKNNSGVAGVRDFIMTDWDSNPDDAIHSYLITVEMANNNPAAQGGPVYAMSAQAQLAWFKGRFTSLANSNINARDRAGISNAMANRFRDLCADTFNASSNNLRGAYNTDIKTAEIGKQAAIKVCNTAYNDRIRTIKSYSELSTEDKASPLLKSAYLFIETEQARLAKENCVNEAYRDYYTHAATGAIALRNRLGTG